MQNAEEANLGTKMLGISGDFHERLGDSAEQQVVEFDFVLADKCVQLMREAEHHMEVRGSREVPVLGPRSNACMPAPGTWGSGDFGSY